MHNSINTIFKNSGSFCVFIISSEENNPIIIIIIISNLNSKIFTFLLIEIKSSKILDFVRIIIYLLRHIIRFLSFNLSF